MKLKVLYEKIYGIIFSVPFFKKLLKIPMLEKLLQYEIISYLVFGVLTTAVNFGVKAIFTLIAGDNYETSVLFSIGPLPFKWIYLIQAAGWIAAVIFSYITNKLFVFESSSWRPAVFIKEFTSFVGARVFTFIAFEEIAFALLLSLLHSSEAEGGLSFWIANIIISVFVIIFNYVASKLVIFRKKGDKNA